MSSKDDAVAQNVLLATQKHSHCHTNTDPTARFQNKFLLANLQKVL